MNKRIAALWKFLTYDIWRITEDEVTKTTFSLYNIIKPTPINMPLLVSER